MIGGAPPAPPPTPPRRKVPSAGPIPPLDNRRLGAAPQGRALGLGGDDGRD